MKKKIKNMKRKISTAIGAAMLGLLETLPVMAASPSLDELPLYTGTMNLANVAKVALTAIIGVSGLVVVLKVGIEWYTSNEQEKPAKGKKLIGTIGGVILLACLPTLIPWLLRFYS